MSRSFRNRILYRRFRDMDLRGSSKRDKKMALWDRETSTPSS
jgi:hypothetical protein